MENAALVALSGQIVLRRQIDSIANNVANINTSGFKREMLNVSMEYLPKARTNAFKGNDRPDAFAADWNSSIQFDQGATQLTGNQFDMSITGPAFFAVQTPAGEQYTRDGRFTLDSAGQLVNKDGYPVLGEGGPITFQPGETDVVISGDGTIAAAGGSKGKVKLVDFADTRVLKKMGQNLFSGTGGTPATTSKVTQGAIETSNVQPVQEMTRMIDVTRAYEMLAGLVKSHDELRSKAVDALGRVSA